MSAKNLFKKQKYPDGSDGPGVLGMIEDPVLAGDPQMPEMPPIEFSPIPKAYLTVNSGEMRGYAYELPEYVVEVGRGGNSGIILPNSYIYVGERHCTILYHGYNKSFTVRDYSPNGIFYRDGRKLSNPTEVYPGDVLLLGNGECEVIFSLETPVYPYNMM